MVQTLARCRECGLPGKLAEGVAWKSGGLIVLRRAHTMRLAMIDERIMREVKAALVSAEGAEAVMDAQRDTASLAVSTLTRGLKGRLSRFGSAKKELLESLEDYSLLLGLGRIELEKHAPGDGGSMLLRNPFDLEMVAGAVTGALEQMDQCVYTSVVSQEGENFFRLILDAAGKRNGEASRRGQAAEHFRSADRGKETGSCGKCGLPASLAGLRWDEVYGVIRASAGGRRISLLPRCMLAAMERQDEGSTGGAGLVGEAVFRSVRRDLEGEADDGYEKAVMPGHEGWVEKLSEKTATRGWGELTGGSHGENWSIEVMNPISDALIAGWLRALYTVAVGREPLIEMSGDVLRRHFELG